jgi:hypothetical protein
MKTSIIVTFSIIVLSLGWYVTLGWADDDEHGLFTPNAGVAPVNHAGYASECGSCHMAYPPGLLPARSWRKIMSGLDQHFGDNAELDPAVLAELTDYVLANSADQSTYRRSRKIMRSVADDAAPLRITEMPYIKREHREIPMRLIHDNPKVRSLSNCIACHRGADKGRFNESGIRIPGYGHWDD